MSRGLLPQDQVVDVINVEQTCNKPSNDQQTRPHKDQQFGLDPSSNDSNALQNSTPFAKNQEAQSASASSLAENKTSPPTSAVSSRRRKSHRPMAAYKSGIIKFKVNSPPLSRGHIPTPEDAISVTSLSGVPLGVSAQLNPSPVKSVLDSPFFNASPMDSSHRVPAESPGTPAPMSAALFEDLSALGLPAESDSSSGSVSMSNSLADLFPSSQEELGQLLNSSSLLFPSDTSTISLIDELFPSVGSSSTSPAHSLLATPAMPSLENTPWLEALSTPILEPANDSFIVPVKPSTNSNTDTSMPTPPMGTGTPAPLSSRKRSHEAIDELAANENANSPVLDAAALRRLRNTDAARRSRLKKMAHMEHLEKRVEELESNNTSLKLKVAILESERNNLEQRDMESVSRIQRLEEQLSQAHAALTARILRAASSSSK
ncbi:uncharacterized protein VTP21DRAFT_368 [Calcarisporiella thermophila]|uniref:uncharacterized protein n=1 Tax=Calcarisporiella thermophila TaxID=911321 RepID=UPI003743EBB0